MSDPIELDPTSFRQTWTRGSDGSFNDIKKEKFAVLLAGGKSIKDASEQVEIATATGALWAKHDDMKMRKRVLRATPAVSQTFTVSIAMIVAELHLNATQAREAGNFKASNDALVSMYEIAKAEKSLLETFDAKLSTTSGKNVVAALQAHLSKASQLPQHAVEAEGEPA